MNFGICSAAEVALIIPLKWHFKGTLDKVICRQDVTPNM